MSQETSAEVTYFLKYVVKSHRSVLPIYALKFYGTILPHKVKKFMSLHTSWDIVTIICTPYYDTSWCLCLNRQSTYTIYAAYSHIILKFNFHVCDMIRTGIALVLMLHFYRMRVCYCKKVNLVPGIVLPWHRTPREKDCSYTYDTVLGISYIILVRKLLIILTFFV